VKRLVIVAACVLLGLAVGGLWTLLQSDRFRAEAGVLVRPTRPAVERLAESSLIESNVAQTLHLSSTPDISAKTGKDGVLTVSVEAGARERARQIDAEAVVILAQRVPQRFPGTTATVLDPAHVAEQTSPTPGRNLLITGLIGFLAGLAAAARTSPRRQPSVAGTSVDPRAERRLQQRIDQVAKREMALAQRAGRLAAREKDLEERDRRQVVVPAPAPQPKPEPVAPQPPPQPAPTGAWTLEQLEHYISSERSHFPERVEDWETYLFFLRQHAAIDGTLPASFDSLIADVYGDAFRR
jgi:hypothetical protein